METATMPTMPDLIARLGVTITAQHVPDNPHMMDGGQMYHYHVTLTRETGETLQTYYSVGPGIVEQAKGNHFAAMVRHERKLRGLFSNTTVYMQELLDKAAKAYKPDAASVLDCLASDAASYDNSRDFEDWAADYGYDPDSRKAEKSYRHIAEAAKKLRHFVGDDYEALLYETERL